MAKLNHNYVKTLSLNEVGQGSGVYFGVVRKIKKGEYEQKHTWFKCRDYFHEVVQAGYDGKEYTQYGFKTDGVRFQKDRTRIAVRVPLDKIAPFTDNFPAFASKMKSLGMGVTKCIEVDDASNVFIIEAHKGWQTSTAMISLFSLLLRWVYMAPDWSSWNKVCQSVSDMGIKPDKTFPEVIGNKDIYKLIRKRKDIFTDGPTNLNDNNFSTSKLHDKGGIKSFFVATVDDADYNANHLYAKKFREMCNAA